MRVAPARMSSLLCSWPAARAAASMRSARRHDGRSRRRRPRSRRRSRSPRARRSTIPPGAQDRRRARRRRSRCAACSPSRARRRTRASRRRRAQPDATQAWGGIVVASGGRLDADGLDLAGATTALVDRRAAAWARATTTARSRDAQVAVPDRRGRAPRHGPRRRRRTRASRAASTASSTPRTSTTRRRRSRAASSRTTRARSSTPRTRPSTAMSSGGGDYITSYASSLVHVAYSTITDAHCAFHFDDVARFEIDHVTAGAATPHGARRARSSTARCSTARARGRTSSATRTSWAARTTSTQENPNGPLTITNTYTTGLDTIDADVDVAARRRRPGADSRRQARADEAGSDAQPRGRTLADPDRRSRERRSRGSTASSSGRDHSPSA